MTTGLDDVLSPATNETGPVLGLDNAGAELMTSTV